MGVLLFVGLAFLTAPLPRSCSKIAWPLSHMFRCQRKDVGSDGELFAAIRDWNPIR
jgi:hypothetical protein